jgi:endonuclease/exonuclease/phosphatase family metal-dependent hydrolase
VTIYSWNVFYRNKRLPAALAFVRDSGADIFCLQEVPKAALEEFTALYPHHAEAVEMERLLPERPLATYSVILSRYPIRNSATIPLDDFQDRLPLRTRLFIFAMKPLGWSRIRKRNAILADIQTPGGLSRVINMHLTLSNPGWRLEEFETAMLHRDQALPTIVCGDFNILDRPHITLINWLGGGRVSDVVRYTRERTAIEKRFVEHELVNPLRGLRTQTLSQSQLDHILVSSQFSIASASVLPERYGSDHNPIRVEIVE